MIICFSDRLGNAKTGLTATQKSGSEDRRFGSFNENKEATPIVVGTIINGPTSSILERSILERSIHLGIDQTGAVNPKGVPKPLPACWIQGRQVRFFYLASFKKSEIEKHLPKKGSLVGIGLDCVLGLPQELGIDWRRALQWTSRFPGYGRAPAQKFFRSIGRGKIWRRKVEVLAQANSIFQEKPFQRNIQTGTFRLWKDMAQDPDFFYVPALEKKKDRKQLPVFEGYPSFSWKRILKTPSRRPSELTRLLRVSKPSLRWTRSHQAQVDRDPNWADALLLALSLKLFRKEALAQKPTPEGSILGFPSQGIGTTIFPGL